MLCQRLQCRNWSFLDGLLNHFVKELNVKEALKSSILVVHKAAAVPLSWSFLNGLLNHVIKELNVEEVLKLPIFVVQKAAAPKNGVEFRQGSNGTMKSSLATSYDVWQRREVLVYPLTHSRTHKAVYGCRHAA